MLLHTLNVTLSLSFNSSKVYIGSKSLVSVANLLLKRERIETSTVFFLSNSGLLFKFLLVQKLNLQRSWWIYFIESGQWHCLAASVWCFKLPKNFFLFSNKIADFFLALALFKVVSSWAIIIVLAPVHRSYLAIFNTLACFEMQTWLPVSPPLPSLLFHIEEQAACLSLCR